MYNFASAKSVFAPANLPKTKGKVSVMVQLSYPASIFLLKISRKSVHLFYVKNGIINTQKEF